MALTFSRIMEKEFISGMMVRKNYVDMLANTKLAFLWILGEKDNYIPFNEVQRKVNIPPNGKLFTLKNSGHQGFIEEKQKAILNLVNFIVDL